jgi:hypothetical protein
MGLRRVASACLVLMQLASPAMADDTAAITRGLDHLVAQQRDDGAIADRDNPLFETWETVLAARALIGSATPAHRDALAGAMRFIAGQHNAQQLLCHNRRCRAATCVETSAEYLHLLLDLGQSDGVRSRLPALRAHQQPDGRHRVANPDVREVLDFASVTAFVLSVATRAGAIEADDRRAWRWLRKRQQRDGSFGVAWEYYGSTGYAGWPAMQTVDAGAWRGASALRSRFLLHARATQQADGRWHATSADAAPAISDELATIFMLLALTQEDGDARARGVAWLRSRQRADGAWSGGWFPIPETRLRKREDVVATALAVLVLQERS